MTDPELQAAMPLLSALAPPAYFTESELVSVLMCRTVTISILHGMCSAAAHAFGYYGVVLGPIFRRYSEGYRFARLACDLVDKHDFFASRAKVYATAGSAALWTQPIETGIDFWRATLGAANETGDLTYACFSMDHFITYFLLRNDPLDAVRREAEKSFQFVSNARFEDVAAVIVSQQRFIATMQGRTPSFSSFSDAAFDEAAFEAQLARSHTPTTVCLYWILKLKARFLSGDYAEALTAAGKANDLLWASAIHVQRLDYFYYTALTVAALYEKASDDEQRRWRELLTTHERQLREWAENYPPTFADKHALVSAEIARLEGRDAEAMRLYEEAIRSAHDQGFIQNEGLGLELAARHYGARGYERIAIASLRDARSCYLQWGAHGKVRQLDRLYPQLREATPPSNPTGAILAPAEHLDLATVIEVSQTISSEIVFEKLIDKIMRLAIEHAGAGRGLLILPQNGGYRIEAEAATSDKSVTVDQRRTPVTAADLPQSVFHHVVRTNESVLLHDASRDSPFSTDDYIRHRRSRSILCLPLLKQTRLLGILYLENELVPHVFDPGRLAILTMLASEAAISLENTRLYADLEEREAKIRRLVDANIIGIYLWEKDGRIVEANNAFLHLLGYDRDDLASGSIGWMGITPQEWLEADAELVRQLRRTGSLPPFEKEYFRKNGDRVPILMGAACFDESGNEGVAFVLDLTERKRAEKALKDREEALRRSEAWLIQGQKLSHTGNWVYNAAATQYLYWSEESYRIWGFDPLRGLPSREDMWRRIHPDDRDAVRREVQDALRENRDFVAEFRLLLPDGAIKYLQATTSHLFSPRGELVEAVSSHIDVTDQKRARDEHERLRQLEADLTHMNRLTMMGELAASLAHEITQPIAAARNNARASLNFLSKQPPDLAEVTEALGCIVEDADRAGQIIGRIRDQVKKAPARMDRFNLNEAIDEVIGMTRSEIARNGVRVQTRLTDELPDVQGDRVQLQQIVLNLILNAAEAMSESDDHIRELSVGATRSGANDILVAVRDSGPGIDPARRERVFDAFYTTKPSGLGMGLSICRSIIDAHGGRLWVEANEPCGAAFQFILPGAERN
jgi:PAS domain S-box-containing protein